MRCLFITLMLLPVVCFGQNLTGKYSTSEGSGSSRTILFSKNGTFTEERFLHMGTTFGRGNYSIKNKVLTLVYLKVPDQDTSAYQLTSKASNSTLANVLLKVFDNNNLALQAMVYTRDAKGNPISGAYTDKEGISNLLIFNNKAIASLTIDVLGYYRVQITIADLIGKNAELTVWLKPAEKNYIAPHRALFNILKFERGSLMLSSKEEGTLTLTKKE